MWSSSLAAAATLLLAVAASPSPPSLSCSSDGFFALGCSTEYIACSGGRALTMNCPDSLVYDEIHERCEYPGNVVACGGKAPEEKGSGIEEGSGSVTDGSGVEGSGEVGSGVEEGSGEEIEDVTGMCTDRADGFYRLAACGENFLGCSGGVAWSMTCPASLKYDEEKQICDYPGNVKGCEEEESSGEEGSGEIEGSGTEEGSGEVDGSGEEGSGVEEGSGEEIEDVTGMCTDRADGFYRLAACGENFLGCSGGVAWSMSCPASLKYDEEKQICDYPGNVKGCEEGSGEVEGSGTEEGPGSEGSGTDGSHDESVTTEDIEEKQIETEDVFVNKDGKEDNEEYVEEIETEDDIIDDNAVVEEKEEIKEEEYVKEIEAEDEIIDDSSVVEEEKEEDVREIEAEGDIIDESSAVVEEEKEESVKVEQEQEQEQEVADYSDNSLSQHDEADVTASCEGRGDGFYAMGCSSDMLACSNGIAHVMPCPAGLVFDEPNQICDHSVHVSACSSRDQLLTDDSLLTTDNNGKPHPEIPRTRDSEVVAATLAPTTPAGPVSSAAAVAVAAASEYAPRQTAQAIRMDRRDAGCKSSDGLFSLDCSVEFVSCRGGVATKLECPEAKTFDESSQSCVSLARHPTCFTHALQPANVIDDDVDMVKEKDDQSDLQKPIDHSFECDFVGARAEEECVDWFRLCESGRGIEMYCMQGYLFDGEAAKCVPAGQLAHCKAQ